MSFVFHEPTTLAEAIALKTRYEPDVQVWAGGTDLMVQIERRQVAPAHVISLDRVPGLRGIAECADPVRPGVCIGAMTAHRTIERSALLLEQYPALPEASQTVGGVQVRVMGTIGGNLCNASPAADTVPPLLAFDATVILEGSGGTRSLPLAEFILGRRRTALQPGELLTAVHLPVLPSRSGSAYLKAGRRKAMEIAICAVATRVSLSADGRCEAVRIALGAVAPRPVRARAAEAVLEGAVPTAERIRQAAVAAVGAAQPISDVRASADYRLMLVEAMTAESLRISLGRLGLDNLRSA